MPDETFSPFRSLLHFERCVPNATRRTRLAVLTMLTISCLMIHRRRDTPAHTRFMIMQK